MLGRPQSRKWCGLTLSDRRNGALACGASKSASAGLMTVVGYRE
jgi:hypothetical protein